MIVPNDLFVLILDRFEKHRVLTCSTFQFTGLRAHERRPEQAVQGGDDARPGLDPQEEHLQAGARAPVAGARKGENEHQLIHLSAFYFHRLETFPNLAF